MKAGRPLPELAAELARQANSKRDFLVSSQALRVRSNGHTDLVVGEPYAMNEVAHQGLAEYLGIPRAFYDRLRQAAGELRVPVLDQDPRAALDDHPLFDVVVDRLLRAKGDERRLIRTLDGTARAVLSDSFNPDLDNLDVFRVAAGIIEAHGLGPEHVVSAEVTERRLYLKVVSPKLQADIRPENLTGRHGEHYFLKEPQVVQAGFILSNSEVGLGSLKVQQVIYKLQCTNLWIKEEAYRQRHIGRSLEADTDGVVYRSDTRAAEAATRLLKLRDHVDAVLNEETFRALVGAMQESTAVRLEGSIEKVVEVTARRFGLADDERTAVLKNLIEGADLSLWGLSNAITATAAHVPSYDRATELEAIGGRLFSLPKGEVKELVRAS